jgi:hypothetical protein
MQVSAALALLIETWLGKGKHNNLNVLATRSGVSYSTVTRLAQAKVEKPLLEQVLAVLDVVAVGQERLEFLSQHYPVIAKAIARESKALKGEGRPSDAALDAFEELFSNPSGFLMAQQVLAKGGLSDGRAKELFGEAGLAQLRQLEKAGVVTLRDGRWYADVDYAATSFESNRRQVISSAKAFQLDSIEVGCGYMATISEGVSVKGAEEMTKALVECANRLREIRDNNPGAHVFVSNLVGYLADPKLAMEEART